MSKVLVTGGSGFIGSHIVDLLLNKGHEVKILDNLQKPVHLDGIPSYVPKEAEFILGDIKSKDDVDKALQGVNIVFHQAAHQGFLPDFSEFFHVNSVGTALIMELITEKKYPVQKVIVASSQAVYGEGKYRCPTCEEKQNSPAIIYPSPRPMSQLVEGDWEIKCPVCGNEMESLLTDEEHVDPHTQYAMSKYTQEMIAINLGRIHGIPTVALRYSITQGPRQSFLNAYSGILRIFCIRMMNDVPPIIYEDGHMKRDYVHIKDVAKANLLVMEKDEANYQVYNVGSGKPTTQLELADALAKKLGKDIAPEIPGEFRLGDVRHITSDISNLKGLGWAPTACLDDILDDYINWVEAQGNVKDYFAQAERVMKQVGAVRHARK